jgi:hypothetical protein
MQRIQMQRIKTSRRQAPPLSSVKGRSREKNVGLDSAAGPVVAGLALSAKVMQAALVTAGEDSLMRRRHDH